MQRRALGATGEHLSIIGMGGIVVSRLPQPEADAIVAEAVDRGVNYFDVAPTYGDAEERLGPALEPHRDGVFLACKTGKRDAEGARHELERSLRHLHTDHFDLYQLHGLTTLAEVETAFGDGGALETVEAARQEGKVRFIGFSAHSVEAAEEALRRYRFDSILFPFNCVCWHHGFGPQVLEAAREAGAARLALKALARTNWPEGGEKKWKKCWYQPFDRREEAALALRFTLSQDLTAAVSSGEPTLFKMAVEIAEEFEPVGPDELARIAALAEPLHPIFPEK